MTTKIEWTDGGESFNPWVGCTKVSLGCDNCYAEAIDARFGMTDSGWGAKANRKRTSDANWKKPIAWNKKAEREGRKIRVFCASMADVFDNHASILPEWRRDLWDLIDATPHLIWQILTKRPQNIFDMLPARWGSAFPNNVHIGISAENQTEYDRRWKHILLYGARVRFVSYEPALGHIHILQNEFIHNPDWVIFGGESGTGARRADHGWFDSLLAQCDYAHIPVFLKQWGTYESNPLTAEVGLDEAKRLDPPSNGKGGALWQGKLIREFPQ